MTFIEKGLDVSPCFDLLPVTTKIDQTMVFVGALFRILKIPDNKNGLECAHPLEFVSWATRCTEPFVIAFSQTST